MIDTTTVKTLTDIKEAVRRRHLKRPNETQAQAINVLLKVVIDIDYAQAEHIVKECWV